MKEYAERERLQIAHIQLERWMDCRGVCVCVFILVLFVCMKYSGNMWLTGVLNNITDKEAKVPYFALSEGRALLWSPGDVMNGNSNAVGVVKERKSGSSGRKE